MTEVQKLKEPALRFPEFSGEWNEKRLGQILEEFQKKSKHQDQYEVLTSARSGLMRQHDYYGEGRITDRNNIGFNIIPPNYITYRSRSDDRRFFFNENNLGITGIISVYYPVFRVIEGSNKFIIGLLKKRTNFIGKYSVGTSQTVLSMPELKRIKLPIPNPDEQEKIAGFLSAVDRRIEQLDRKRELLQQYKKGMMQKLFSRELRFKDDNGNDFPDWEEKRLGKILLSYKLGGNYSNSEKQTAHHLIKMGNIGRGQIKLDKIEFIKSNERIDEEDKIQYGDLFFNTRNTLDLVGKVAIWRGELDLAYYNSNLMRMKFENNFFMNYRFNSFQGIKALKRIATGTTSVAAIYTKDLLKVIFSIPTHPEEQKKIAAFLSSLDRKIELVALELTHAKAFKKGLLQQMFV